MIHHKRPFSFVDVTTVEALATNLACHTWTLCACFRFGGLLWANDSFSEDSAQEYAVLREKSDGTVEQVESIAFSWCTVESASKHILALIDAAPETLVVYDTFRLQPHPQGSCAQCA